jgi:predicted GIY-YIG superfamily endonuclease
MSNIELSDFKFFKMWPRHLLWKKDKNGLLIKREVPELQRPGVYILYRGDELYYVGKANRLFSRLHDHSNKITDEYYAHWDYFSAFALADTVKDTRAKMTELEAILIAAMPRATNRSTPRFQRVRIPKSLLKSLSEIPQRVYE